MAYRTTAAVFAAFLTVAGSTGAVFAQDATPTEAPAAPAAEAPAAEAPAAEAPAAAAPAAEAPAADAPAAPAAEAPAAPPSAPANADEAQVGQAYPRETHGDWMLRCIKSPDGKDPCELYQLLKDADGGAVAEASVLSMKEQVAAVVTFVAPLETDLQAGLGLAIDANKPSRFPFMLCAQVGCISRVGMSQAEVDALKRGKEATVSLLPFGAQPDQMVGLKLSLNGFTAGYNALLEANKDIVIPGSPAAPAQAGGAAAPTAPAAPADPATPPTR